MAPLTRVQHLGIGITVGFVTAVILAAVAFSVYKRRLEMSVLTKLPKPTLRDDLIHWKGFIDRSHRLGSARYVVDQIDKAEAKIAYKPFSWRVTPLQSYSLTENVFFDGYIEDWASNFFKRSFTEAKDVPQSIFDEEGLVALAGPPVNGGTWSEALARSEERHRSMRCFIAQAIFKHIHPGCSPEMTLLPPEIVTCYQWLESESTCHSKQKHGRSAGVGPALEDYTAIWREAAFLIVQNRYRMQYLPVQPFGADSGDPRYPRVRELTRKIIEATRTEAIKNWGHMDSAEYHLERIISQASNLGFLLFGQGEDAWEACWDKSDEDKDRFIVFPSVRLIRDWKVRVSEPAAFSK
ncbi:hypothetical protein ACJ41O_003196 [Fusarium nematophilum]